MGVLDTVTKGLLQRLEDLEIRGRVHPNYSSVAISQNTEKSPGDIKRLASVENHQLTMI